jgi:hypothetical protein
MPDIDIFLPEFFAKRPQCAFDRFKFAHVIIPIERHFGVADVASSSSFVTPRHGIHPRHHAHPSQQMLAFRLNRQVVENVTRIKAFLSTFEGP